MAQVYNYAREEVRGVAEEVKSFNVHFPVGLYRRLKVQAAVEDRSMRSLILEAVERLLQEREAGKRA